VIETLTNRHPVDELADVRAQIKVLQEHEARLRAVVLRGDCALAGDDYVANIKIKPQSRVDLPALQKHFGAALKPFLMTRQITQVWVKARA